MTRLKYTPLLLALVGGLASAQDIELPQRVYQEILVTGGADAVRSTAGSASFLDEEAIARFDQTDINELLTQVPGVYIRTEDGYGLRPNIGIRGATAERSQKITLMEDGILIAPAPYSAPAAYYVPNVNRMSAVEVFKGPAAIHYGPHTVGGAVNLVTAPLPSEREGQVSLSAGTDGYQKGRLVYGDRYEQFSYQVDLLNYGADGFKELDGGGDTGFERNDLNLKLGWKTRPGAPVAHSVTLKLGYADEDSDETYLGLTEEDFETNPDRRYLGSAADRFESEHTQAHLLHQASFLSGWQWINKLYVNRFDRSWKKLDGFFAAPADEGDYSSNLSAGTIFQRPEIFARQLSLLRGEINASDRLSDRLDVTDNAREYGSQGLETEVQHQLGLGQWQHELAVGLRFHHDYVDRTHQPFGYRVQDGRLVFDGQTDRPLKTDNRAETDAWALYVSDELRRGPWKVNLGLRAEHIEGEVENRADGSRRGNTQDIVIPGAGLFYEWSDNLGLLVGVNKGFSPSGPGADDSVEPEESLNLEYGFRYQAAQLTVDAIGFFSDYDNLLGRCRVSDVGCEPGEEFNGGRVEIAGLELTGDWVLSLSDRVDVPLSLAYTYTETAFQSDFTSGFSQWGTVLAGDELPYTPDHQARLGIGLMALDWQIDLALKYSGEMRDRPGQGEPTERNRLSAYTTVDVSARYEWSSELSLQLVVDNLTDERELVSRRPFGARPNAPRMVQAGVTYRF